DRVFVIKGFGTVVTGTLLSGGIGKEDEVEVFPSRRRVRVRSVQVHGADAERAHAGERTALNLAGIAKEDLARGMTLAPAGTLVTTIRFDVELNLLRDARPLPDHAQVHLHLHSLETVAQVVLYEGVTLAPGKSAFAQLRVRGPLLVLPGDRFIIRHFSPVETIGGGVVLDNLPAEKRLKPDAARSLLTTFKNGSPGEKLLARVERRGASGLALRHAVAEMGIPPAQVEADGAEAVGAGAVLRFGDIMIANKNFLAVQELIEIGVKGFHERNPLVGGINRQELKERLRVPPEIFEAALGSLVAAKKIELQGDQVKAAGRSVVMKDDEAEAKETIERAFSSAGLKVPALKDVLAGLPLEKLRAQKLVTLLLRDRVLVKLADDLVFHQSALEELRKTVRAQKAKSARMDVGAFKELVGVTRKYAIPLLEMLDRERITRREGDVRVIL
ncbi:MAG: SelB C-terminal domain-containing protein, partial [Terriglobales bacterium]